MPNPSSIHRKIPKTASGQSNAALCFRPIEKVALGKAAEASKEYNWVLLNTQDPELIKRVQLGLQATGRQLGTISPASAIAVPQPLGQTTLSAAPPGSQASAQTGPVIGATGHLRIVDCYAPWCGWCRKFEPLFNRAETAYKGRVDFERIDAEAPENARFVAAYHIQAYPTILFFNQQGELVKRIDGAPQKYEDFRRHVGKAFPSLH